MISPRLEQTPACLTTKPNWPAPRNVQAAVTTRGSLLTTTHSGYDNFNLALHVEDRKENVLRNRLKLQSALDLKHPPCWLRQTHSNTVVQATPDIELTADASISSTHHHACTVLTADCLPVLFCNQQGTEVAAAHAGWRGLANGILENTISAMTSTPENIMAWLGPAIGPENFEVGEEVVQQFCGHTASAKNAFTFTRLQQNKAHYLADIYQLARLRLQLAGVKSIYGGHFCTVEQQHLFYSFRGQQSTGRFASLIWIT